MSSSTALSKTGRVILDWYEVEYTTHLNVAAAYDPCTGDPLPGGWEAEWSSVYADLAELAAEYGDCEFAHRVIDDKLRPVWADNPTIPFNGSAFENLEVLLALRNVGERCPPQADFSASPTSGVVPLTVDFTNASTGDYDTCAWAFGDGGASIDCNDPSHEYTAPGVYTVSLTVSGLGSTDTLTRTSYVTIQHAVFLPLVVRNHQ